jgi:hypothetical protein
MLHEGSLSELSTEYLSHRASNVFFLPGLTFLASFKVSIISFSKKLSFDFKYEEFFF